MSDKKWDLEPQGEVPQVIFAAPRTENCPQDTKITETEGPLDLSVNKSQDSEAKDSPPAQEKIDEGGQPSSKKDVKLKCLPKYQGMRFFNYFGCWLYGAFSNSTPKEGSNR